MVAAPAQPACANCQSASGTQRCGHCHAIAYCGKACQREHWAKHKPFCKLSLSREPSVGAPVEPKPPAELNEVLYPYDRFLKLRRLPGLLAAQPVGLYNCGNTCFANSLLQCLLHTQPLLAYLRSEEHSKGCSKPRPTDWCLLCELQSLAEQVAEAQEAGLPARAISPAAITRSVWQIAPHFRPGQQEDAHDLYVTALDLMERVMVREAGGKEAHPDQRSRETTLVGHCFTGYVCYQTVCTSCGWISQRFDTKVALECEVSVRTPSVEASLVASFADEQLDANNTYKCDRCKEMVRATRRSCVEVAPNVLVLCLKRFGLGRFAKNNRRVAYSETLDLSPCMAEGGADPDGATYRLFAVLVHVDMMNSTAYGHYVSYVRLSSGAWFLCDDSHVAQVPADQALSQNAYMLFYMRDQPRPAPQPTPDGAARHTAAAVPLKRAPCHGSAPIPHHPSHSAANGPGPAAANGRRVTPVANGISHPQPSPVSNGVGTRVIDTSSDGGTGSGSSSNGGSGSSSSNGGSGSSSSSNGGSGSSSSNGGSGSSSSSNGGSGSRQYVDNQGTDTEGPGIANGAGPSLPVSNGVLANGNPAAPICANGNGLPAFQHAPDNGPTPLKHPPTPPPPLRFAGMSIPADQAGLPEPTWRFQPRPSTDGGATGPASSSGGAQTPAYSNGAGAGAGTQPLHGPGLVTLAVQLPGVTRATDVQVAVCGQQAAVWVPGRHLLRLDLPPPPPLPGDGSAGGAVPTAPERQGREPGAGPSAWAGAADGVAGVYCLDDVALKARTGRLRLRLSVAAERAGRREVYAAGDRWTHGEPPGESSAA